MFHVHLKRMHILLLLHGMVYVVAQSLSYVRLFVTPWTAARHAPLSIRLPRQEYWSGSPFPPPGHLPNPGIERESPALAGRFFTTEPPGKPNSFAHSMPTVSIGELEQ